MPALELRFNAEELRANGTRIQVVIGPSTLEVQELGSTGLELPREISISGLIDSGASITVINPQVARTCGLRQTGFALVSAAGSSAEYPEYAASLAFPNSNLKRFDIVRVVACQLPHQPIACLIGRDVLRRWNFQYDGPNSRIRIED